MKLNEEKKVEFLMNINEDHQFQKRKTKMIKKHNLANQELQLIPHE